MRLNRIGIDIVHGCQLQCIGCPNSTLKPKIKYCDPSDFEKMLKNIDAKVDILRLYNFGEPMLHPLLDEMVKIIGKSHLKPKQVDITTNGQYWDEKVFRSTFSQNIITHLYVSCDGDCTPQSYEKLRYPAKWEKFLEFMVRMKLLKRDVCSKLHLGTRTITENKYKKRWKNMFGIYGFKPEFRQWTTRTDVVNAPWKPKNVPKGICKYAKRNDLLYVDYDGTVVPCCVHPQAGVYGSLLSTKASKILNDNQGAGYNTYWFRYNMKKNRKLLDVCKDCTKT